MPEDAERTLINQLTAGLRSQRNETGFVSDCAVVPFGAEDLIATVDGFAQATHFPEGVGAEGAGRLAAGAALADLASAGADLVGVLAAYGIPTDLDRATVVALGEAIATRVETAGGEVLGGDTKPREELTVTVTALGTCPSGEAMIRTEARPGDAVIVTGPLGGAGAALDRIREGGDADEADPLVPELRLEAGQVLREAGARCAMDLSDGLADAATAIADASDVSVQLEADQVPLHAWASGIESGLAHALSTGGDYELAATVAASETEGLLSALAERGLEAAVVGRVQEGAGADLVREDETIELGRGFEHRFATE